MPIAAIPEYIGKQDLSEASPGMRFSMYLPIWTERADQEKQIRKMAGAKSPQGRELGQILEQQGMDAAISHAKQARGRFPALWHKNDQGAQSAWKRVSGLSGDDKVRMQALVARQQALASTACTGDEVMVVDGEAVAPFTTGLGNEHPLENGFAFLWPYGLPYLPGSGVKGVLRQAARELAGVAAAEWDMESDWTATAIDALFGKEDSNDARRGALSFWDVIPGIEGDKLIVEVMTGHQSHYYMQGESPHESGQPIPVYFLTVPPGSRFTFHVVCDLPFLRRIAPELAENDRWRRLLQQAFEHAFDWLGFGAKTAVGYGAMRFDEAAAREREEQARQQAFAQLSPEEQALEALRKTCEEEQRKGLLSAGCQTAQKRLELLKAAQAWEDPVHRRSAARLIRQTLEALPWSKKQKKQGIADELAKLEAE